MKNYSYKLIYYQKNTNSSFFVDDDEGEIVKNKNVRGWSFTDEYGAGYIYPMMKNENIEEIEEEYEIKGKCTCCYECVKNENCDDDDDEEGKKYCKENKCVECEKDGDCNNMKNNEEKICSNEGKCIEMIESCRNDDECKNDEICQRNGECKNGCRGDENCARNEVCNINRECMIKSCENDNECKSGEICMGYKCSENGCRDNFDCDDYNHVCIDNYCTFIKDSESCYNDNDCSDEYYCEYEYFVCIKRETVINKRTTEVLPAAVCSIYGVISLFILSTSYSVVTNIANHRLVNECDEKCENIYYTHSDSMVDNVEVKKKSDKNIKRKSDSECNGICRVSSFLNKKDKNHGEIISYAGFTCHEKSLTIVITAVQKDIYTFKSGIEYDPTQRMFRSMLSRFCKSVKYGYWSRHKKRKPKWVESIACIGDDKSIRCEHAVN